MEEAQRLIELAAARHVSLCCCESFTCGLFASLIGSVSGASAVFKGGLVTYQSPMKTVLAHVDPALIAQDGVISAQCAKAMACNTREIMDCDYCVSFTGNAGPSAMEGKPAGLVYCALAGRNQVQVFEWQMDLPRNELRREACRKMMQILIGELSENQTSCV